MWVKCDKCGKARKLKLRKDEVWMVQWQCECGYKNYKIVNPNTQPPYDKKTEEQND